MESESRTNGITLLPCPFCGGEAETDVYGATGQWSVECKCGARIEKLIYDEDSAIEAWNTRAERTCRAELKGFDPSRTVNTCHYACSACGYAINQEDNYCRSCGAKVVD